MILLPESFLTPLSEALLVSEPRGLSPLSDAKNFLGVAVKEHPATGSLRRN